MQEPYRRIDPLIRQDAISAIKRTNLDFPNPSSEDEPLSVEDVWAEGG